MYILYGAKNKYTVRVRNCENSIKDLNAKVLAILGKSGKSDYDQQQEQQQATVDSASDSESEDETQTTGKFMKGYSIKSFIESGTKSLRRLVKNVLKLVEIGWETWTGLGNEENFLSGL